ncbi:MAG: hypothetical protein HYX78_10505 [Armatimonadetes bacterium]|nr:hypothetical protein [Armatimonadota bacterium]
MEKRRYVGDPENYRTKQEKEDWMKKDPIARFGARLEKQGILSWQGRQQVQADVMCEITEAIKFAEVGPDPRPEDADMYVYYDREAENR